MGSAKADPLQQKTIPKPYGKVILTLKNQLLPEEKLSPTPSQNDGLDNETETDLRIYGCELIQTAGILLKLPQVAMATGQVLLQRFYYSKSLVRHPVDHTAMACVCLASKIEEAPRRVRDVINVFTHIRQVNSNKTIQPVILDQNYIHLKNLVIKAERRVLKELGFCVHIKHPHKIIVMYLQVLGYEKNQKLMQYSWNYMNDSLRTDVFVRYQPETVACACIYLTARKLKLPLPKNPSWYTIFGANELEIRDISYKILKLYTRPKANIDLLEKKIDELSKKYHDARTKARSGGSCGGNNNSGNNTPNNNDSNSPNQQQQPQPLSQQQQQSQQKTIAGAHNAWGGFISRSGSHIAPPVVNIEKRSRSRSPPQRSPITKHKRSKKHRSRSRSPTTTRNHKRNKRRSHTRSRSISPQQQPPLPSLPPPPPPPSSTTTTATTGTTTTTTTSYSHSKRSGSTSSGSSSSRKQRRANSIDRYERERNNDRHDNKKWDSRDKDDKYSSSSRDKKSSSKHDSRERSKDRRR